MSTRRMQRVEQLLKEELSVILQREIKDPRIGFITVTGTSVSADLGHAKVYVSIMGDAAVKEQSMEGLKSAAGYVQRMLAPRVKIKFMPHIEFILDDSIDRGFHVEEILKKIEEQKRDA